ncbi:hypothetical protein ACWNX6_00180 [Candidatus Vidania fulgoroideorum]
MINKKRIKNLVSFKKIKKSINVLKKENKVENLYRVISIIDKNRKFKKGKKNRLKRKIYKLYNKRQQDSNL